MPTSYTKEKTLAEINLIYGAVDKQNYLAYVTSKLLSIGFSSDYVLFQIINESLRITTTVPTVLRVPDHDIQAGDYTIPAGWTFMGYPSVHFNPEKYERILLYLTYGAGR